MRMDLALEFLLRGFVNSSAGDKTGDCSWLIVFPSGIVCGGDTVILLDRLPMLFSSPPPSVGEAKKSLLGDVIDADVGDATRAAG